MSPIIDAHLHVWDETAGGRETEVMSRGSYSPQAQASVELFMDYMDEAGVEKAVFVQPWFYHWDNSYMVKCMKRYPDRFRGVCVVDPRGAAAATALKKWRAEGVTGIRLRSFRRDEGGGPGPWLGTEETMPLWEAIAETDTIACPVHAGGDLARLPAVLKRFPNVRVVIDHLNHPVPKAGLNQPAFSPVLELASHPTVFVKLSGYHHWSGERYPYRDAMPYIQAAVKAFGADRCMWGSDFPHVLAGCGYVRSRNFLTREATFLSKGQLDAIMGGTAERLWFGQR